MFPIYPMICLAGSIAIDTIQKLYFFIRTKLSSLHIAYHYLQYTVHITFFAILICGFLGISRSLAIYKGKKFMFQSTLQSILLLIKCINIKIYFN